MLRFFKLPLTRIGVLFFILDTVAIFGAVYLAVAIRKLDLAGLDQFIKSGLFLKASLVVVVYLVLMYFHDLMYHVTKLRRRGMEFQLFQAMCLLAIVLFTLYYWFPALSLGRGFFLLMMPMILTVSATFRMIYLRLTQNPVFGEKVLILGSQGVARSVGEEIMRRTDMGFRIIGFVDEDPANVGKPVLNPKVIGSYRDITDIIDKEQIRTVIVALPDRRGRLPVQALLHCKLHGVRILDGISFYERITGKISVEELKPSWLIFSEGFDRRKVTLALKRVLDVASAITGLILVAPVFLLLPLLIKWDSPGPVFYRQQRIGEGEKIFTLLKFRSMTIDTGNDAGLSVWAKEDDPRLTRVGRIIRKLRVDELPQLINVLNGDMSLIGPRPDIQYLKAQLEDCIPYYNLRYTVKPGITGWAQIRSSYVSNLEEGKLRQQHDLYYIKNMALMLDLVIILSTIKIVLFGQGAR